MDLELWRRVPRVATWRRHRGSELWRCAAAVGTSRYGALPYCWLLLEFPVFVPQGLRFAYLFSEWFELGCRVEKFAEGVNSAHCQNLVELEPPPLSLAG